MSSQQSSTASNAGAPRAVHGRPFQNCEALFQEALQFMNETGRNAITVQLYGSEDGPNEPKTITLIMYRTGEYEIVDVPGPASSNNN
ncbi:hypothetical protein FBEOM_3284 [Fusarium beomiforme]|uniref:Uncharacterized protein n=1 Tax=Fusarium beomiforme TaxID=44412 RepID=A0A9P5DZ64_9HYPO|nr:hypothetical protein FBEOM_3284 [Fusarium beomiforme]